MDITIHLNERAAERFFEAYERTGQNCTNAEYAAMLLSDHLRAIHNYYKSQDAEERSNEE